MRSRQFAAAGPPSHPPVIHVHIMLRHHGAHFARGESMRKAMMGGGGGCGRSRRRRRHKGNMRVTVCIAKIVMGGIAAVL